MLDLQSLKLLAEFASECENETEGALDVVRVQSLQLVGTCYSPLIYDLKSSSSYEQLILLLKKVNEYLMKNPNLPDKIDAIAKEKSWLEEIRYSKGNTEASSLKQAERINRTGVFSFGFKDDKISYSLNDIISLHVPDDKEKEKNYSYSQLVDLHDRLTLVVGKKEEEQELIRYFEDIFEGLIRMGEIYLNLIKCGNILFKNWNATIYCDKNSPNTININFGLKNETTKLFGNRKNEKTTINSINKTAKFLKKCYDEWIAHTNKKRDIFNELNYFTIDQIVILRTKLAEIINRRKDLALTKKTVIDLVYNLNNEISFELLQSAFNYALDQGFNKLKETSSDDSKKNDSKKAKDAKLIDTETDKLFKEIIEDYDFRIELLAKAYNSLDLDDKNDKDALIRYCLEHQESSDDEESFNTDNNQAQFINFNQISRKFSTNKNNLDEQYESVYECFLDYLECNFEDMISLTNLGHMLKYIKSESKRIIKRTNPAWLYNDVPNLIVCPQNEIIKRTLGIYMNTPNEPLPSNDEILYCNSTTNCEEVELFWKRALLTDSNDQNDKIYCLINAQNLPYDQAVKAQISFERIFTNRNLDDSKIYKRYSLCIICSLEKEDKSVFVTSFNKFRKNVPLDKTINNDLNLYLFEKFKFENSLLSKYEKDGLNSRVITTDRAGDGKSHYITHLVDKAKSEEKIEYCCISIKEQTLPFELVFESLKKYESKNNNQLPIIFHLDIAYEVWYDVDYFLFNLLCLSIIKNKNGQIFRKLSKKDLFLIEIMSPIVKENDKYSALHSILDILPTLKCFSPVEILNYINEAKELPHNICPLLFDEKVLRSDLIQRPCQYLQVLDLANNFDKFTYPSRRLIGVKDCLEILLKHIENKMPSWSDIINFCKFLNVQLIDCEKSSFCNIGLTGDVLPGFKTFVIRFMVQMSHDFALKSLDISDSSSALKFNSTNNVEFHLDQLKIRRKWENDPHPYLFFNTDGHTFTFFGFNVNTATGQLIDPQTNRLLYNGTITLSAQLIQSINNQNISVLKEDIRKLSKIEKIYKLLCVMGVEWALKENGFSQIVDPDPSYELTMDNLLKILAIYMRLRADIPVVIMGETGCGKTR